MTGKKSTATTTFELSGPDDNDEIVDADLDKSSSWWSWRRRRRQRQRDEYSPLPSSSTTTTTTATSSGRRITIPILLALIAVLIAFYIGGTMKTTTSAADTDVSTQSALQDNVGPATSSPASTTGDSSSPPITSQSQPSSSSSSAAQAIDTWPPPKEEEQKEEQKEEEVEEPEEEDEEAGKDFAPNSSITDNPIRRPVAVLHLGKSICSLLNDIEESPPHGHCCLLLTTLSLLFRVCCKVQRRQPHEIYKNFWEVKIMIMLQNT